MHSHSHCWHRRCTLLLLLLQAADAASLVHAHGGRHWTPSLDDHRLSLVARLEAAG
jgi:hypothetical protein